MLLVQPSQTKNPQLPFQPEFGLAAPAADSSTELGLGPGRIDGVDVGTGRDHLVQRIEEVCVELDVGRRQSIVELRRGAGADDDRRDGRVFRGPCVGDVGHRKAGLIGQFT
jgi:hypothetical protein